MSANQTPVPSAPKFPIVSYVFDAGDRKFKIDHARVASVIVDGSTDKINPAVLAAMVDVMLKDLVHRSSWAKGITDKDADETDRLLAILTGTAVSGRFKITDADKVKANEIMKRYKMAPDAAVKLYESGNPGLKYVDDFDELCKRYMMRRRREAEANKNAL
jgi:hypothetical protein